MMIEDEMYGMIPSQDARLLEGAAENMLKMRTAYHPGC